VRSPVNPSAFGGVTETTAGEHDRTQARAEPERHGQGCRAHERPGHEKDRSLGFAKGFQARDPDGHALELIER
jgi:hypothetical protein